jgi:hypothetical protein
MLGAGAWPDIGNQCLDMGSHNGGPGIGLVRTDALISPPVPLLADWLTGHKLIRAAGRHVPFTSLTTECCQACGRELSVDAASENDKRPASSRC